MNPHNLIKVIHNTDNFYYQCSNCLVSAWKDIETFNYHCTKDGAIDNFLSSVSDKLQVTTHAFDKKEPFHVVYHNNLLYLLSTAGYALYIIECLYSKDEWLARSIIV